MFKASKWAISSGNFRTTGHSRWRRINIRLWSCEAFTFGTAPDLLLWLRKLSTIYSTSYRFSGTCYKRNFTTSSTHKKGTLNRKIRALLSPSTLINLKNKGEKCIASRLYYLSYSICEYKAYFLAFSIPKREQNDELLIMVNKLAEEFQALCVQYKRIPRRMLINTSRKIQLVILKLS